MCALVLISALLVSRVTGHSDSGHASWTRAHVKQTSKTVNLSKQPKDGSKDCEFPSPSRFHTFQHARCIREQFANMTLRSPGSLQLQLQPNNICCFCYSCRGLALHRTDWTIWKRMIHVLVQIYWLTVYSLTIRAVVVHLGVKLPQGFQNTYSYNFALEWVCAMGGIYICYFV